MHQLIFKRKRESFKSLSRMLCFFSLLPPSFSIRSRYDSNWYVRDVSASWFRIWIPMDARTGSWISDEPLRRMGVSKPYRWFSNRAYITESFSHSLSSLLNSFYFFTVWSVRNMYTTLACSCIRYDLILCSKSVKGAGGVSALGY